MNEPIIVVKSKIGEIDVELTFANRKAAVDVCAQLRVAGHEAKAVMIKELD